MQTQEVCVPPQGIVWCILHMQVLHVRPLTKDCSLRAPSSEASSMNMAISLWILPITNASAVATNKGNCGKEIHHTPLHTNAHVHIHTHMHIQTHTDTHRYMYIYITIHNIHDCTSVCTLYIYISMHRAYTVHMHTAYY